MTLRLYDTSARSTRDFVPLVPGKVSMYLCGATVQASPHVGHLRSGIVFDVLTRWLRESGYQVTLCRNVTDIDDKILAKAETEQRPWWAVAAHYERAFTAAYEVLGCLPPTVEPRATGHVTQMVELMQRLIDNGYAYAAAGDVYFNVNAFADYGALSNQRPADMLPASDSEHGDRKRDPRDFALWKGAKPGEPSWPTPWGDGRPGWHLECSAMAYAYLGEAFDIHGGGLDLVFPHHENEIAQSRAAGYGFAQYWLHNAWVTASGEKMSKSLGNTMVVSEVVKSIRPIELRWYLVGAHYRSNLEYSEAALQESGAAFRRIEGFLKRATAKSGAIDIASAELPVAFVDAMNDDLGVPAGLAVLHELVTEGNTILNAGSATARLAEIVGMVRRALAVLGVDPMADEWNQVGDTAKWEEVVDALVQAQLAQRNAARAAKDWAASDAIRDGLKAAGISIEDTADGARWSLLED